MPRVPIDKKSEIRLDFSPVPMNPLRCIFIYWNGIVVYVVELSVIYKKV